MMRAIIIHIAYVIEVENTNTGQTHRYTCPEDLPCKRLCLQIIRTHRTQQSKEKEDTQIAEPHITVTMLAERVFDRPYDG